MKVAALVPRRPDGGRRDDLWRFLQDRWSDLHPDVTVVEGDHLDGPFNRSAAINAAATKAGRWGVAIVADADSFVSVDQLAAAIETADRTGQITFAYDRFCYLNRPMSDRVMAGFDGNWWPGVEWTLHGTCSSMVVVPRRLWDEVGGFDAGFVGWGMEDIGFSLSCQALGGGLQRIPGDVWHLNHPTSPENHHESPLYLANVARMKRYEACNYDAAKMADLLAELKVGQ